MRRVRVLLAVALAASAAGCSSDSTAADAISYASIQQLMRQQWEFRETEVASCMAQEGFDYFAEEWSASGSSGTPGATDPDSRLFDVAYDVEHAASHGFGVVEAGLMRSPTPQQGRTSKNADYRESLGNSERLAYEAALNGDDGCAVTAEALAQSEFEERVAAVDETANALRTRITSDARFRQIDADWKSCMGKRGWEAETILGFDEVVSDEIFRRLAELTREDEPRESRVELDEAVVDQLFEFERGAAVDHAECWGESSGDYADVLDDAYAALGG